ncbi:protein FMC1 homolog [Ixodes scapularis]|uniref:protein FMC1 homolog n=1 Tax=Ixodes scapularis TaxID=6945 RepID=UPI001A9F159B|nr:protein FMC1 homolog [Ixodes scapularis]
MAASKESILLIRGVLRELRKAFPGRPLRDHLAVRYLLSEARRHQVTEKRLCRAHMELQGQTATYLCYLASTRKGHELQQQYHGRKERSVEESARLVGLALPKPPGDTKDC